MSQKLDVFERSIARREKQSVFSGKIPTLAVGLTAVLLVAVVVAVMLPGSGSVKEPAPVASLPSTNPELMVTERYVREAASRSKAARPATNPELIATERYIREAASRSEAALLATNPELMAVARHSEAAARRAAATLLATNPELMVARRYRAPVAHNLDSILDAIPAPQILAPKAALASDEAETLAVNPELVTYRRYVLGRDR